MDELKHGDYEKTETDEELQHESFKTKEERVHRSFGKRIGSAMIIVLGAIIGVFGGTYPFLLGIGFISMGATWEILHVSKKKYPLCIHIVTYIFVFLLSYWFFIGGNIQAYLDDPSTYYFSISDHSTNLFFPFGVIVVFTIIYFIIAIISDKFTFADVAHFVTLGLLIGMGVQSACYIRYHSFYLINLDIYADYEWFPGYTSSSLKGTWQFEYFLSTLPFLYMALGTVANDTFAWLGGLLLGKHHMNPRVSPNKTWEGFFSGYICSALVYMGVAFLFAGIGLPVLPLFTMDKWYNIIIVSLVLPILGVIGDLSFSLIKRYYGTKDYSNIFPGHGGILDRFDSYLFVCLGFASLMMVFSGGVTLFV